MSDHRTIARNPQTTAMDSSALMPPPPPRPAAWPNHKPPGKKSGGPQRRDSKPRAAAVAANRRIDEGLPPETEPFINRLARLLARELRQGTEEGDDDRVALVNITCRGDHLVVAATLSAPTRITINAERLVPRQAPVVVAEEEEEKEIERGYVGDTAHYHQSPVDSETADASPDRVDLEVGMGLNSSYYAYPTELNASFRLFPVAAAGPNVSFAPPVLFDEEEEEHAPMNLLDDSAAPFAFLGTAATTKITTPVSPRPARDEPTPFDFGSDSMRWRL